MEDDYKELNTKELSKVCALLNDQCRTLFGLVQILKLRSERQEEEINKLKFHIESIENSRRSH